MSAANDIKEDRVAVFEYISHRRVCGSDCKYSNFCPVMPDAMMNNNCIIHSRYKTLFDPFYNLYVGGFEGLKTELTNIAFKLQMDAKTNEDAMTYFTSVIKIMQSSYAPEKTTKDDEITQVIFSTPIIGGTTLPNESEEGKEEDLKE